MKYYLVTLGCPKNNVDSEGMSSILQARGHTPVDDADDADLLIVNTCGFIKAARDEALDVLNDLGTQKRPGQRLVATGCMIEHHSAQVQALPEVDATLSTRQWMHIDSLIDTTLESSNNAQAEPAATEEPATESYADWRTLPFRRSISEPSAYLKISDGCDLRCAFCTIPAIKGDMHSKPLAAIVEEAHELVAQGARELVLVAQHLTDYGRDRGEHEGLSTLLNTLCQELPPDVWVRLMYAYPTSITPRLVETMARHPQICAYLDMPLQHAHPDTLHRMRRPPDIDHTRRVVADLRAAMPDIALRSTFIVGFPGETNTEFQTLLDFLKEMQFEWVGFFRYSREAGTPAAALPNQVAPRAIERRWHRAMQLQQGISLERNRRWHNRALTILVEGNGVTDDGHELIVGRSFREAPGIDGQVFAWGTAAQGTHARVHINHATEYDLWGEVAEIAHTAHTDDEPEYQHE